MEPRNTIELIQKKAIEQYSHSVRDMYYVHDAVKEHLKGIATETKEGINVVIDGIPVKLSQGITANNKTFYAINNQEVIAVPNLFYAKSRAHTRHWLDSVLENKSMTDILKEAKILTPNYNCKILESKSLTLSVLSLSHTNVFKKQGITILDEKNDAHLFDSEENLKNPDYIKNLFSGITEDIIHLLSLQIPININKFHFALVNAKKDGAIKKLKLYCHNFSSKDQRLFPLKGLENLKNANGSANGKAIYDTSYQWVTNAIDSVFALMINTTKPETSTLTDELVTIVTEKVIFNINHERPALQFLMQKALPYNEKSLAALIQSGKINIAKGLIYAGKNVNIPDEKGLTPIKAALKINDVHLVGLLLNYRATLNSTEFMDYIDSLPKSTDLMPWILLIENYYVYAESSKYHNVMHIALSKSNEQCIDYLLAKGLSRYESILPSRPNLLEFALENDDLQSTIKIIKSYKDPKTYMNQINTALMIAVKKNNPYALSRLLKEFSKDIDLDILQKIFNAAAKFNKYNAANILLSHSKECITSDSIYYVIKDENIEFFKLMMAIDEKEILKKLLKQLSSRKLINPLPWAKLFTEEYINLRSIYLNQTPLMVFVEYDACIKPLLDAKAEIDAQDRSGNTALILAYRARNKKSIAILQRAGANPEIVNRLGNKASDYLKTGYMSLFDENTSVEKNLTSDQKLEESICIIL